MEGPVLPDEFLWAFVMSIKRKGILARARRIFSEGFWELRSELLSVGQWVREEKEDFKKDVICLVKIFGVKWFQAAMICKHWTTGLSIVGTEMSLKDIYQPPTVFTSFSSSLVAQKIIKTLPAIQETQVWSLGEDDPLEKEMATHSIFMPRESHGQRSLVGYSPWGHKRVGHNWATNTHTYTYVMID